MSDPVIVTGTLPTVAESTQDFTSTGFGTPSGAFVITSGAGTINPHASYLISKGFWDGTTQCAVSYSSQDGSVNANCGMFASYDSIAHIADVGGISGPLAEFTISNITDGVRITRAAGTWDNDSFVTVILFPAGYGAHIEKLPDNASQDGSNSISSLAFEPKFLAMMSAREQNYDQTNVVSFGFADKDGNQAHYSYVALDAGADNEVYGYAGNNRVLSRLTSGSVVRSYEVTSWGADSIEITTRGGAGTGEHLYCLVLGDVDCSVRVGNFTTPASTGNSNVATTGLDPSCVLSALTSQQAFNTIGATAENFSLCFGVKDASEEHSFAFWDNDGASNGDNGVSFNASQIIDLEDTDGAAGIADATASLGTEKFTLNYSAVPATATTGFFVAFGAATSGVSNNPIAQFLNKPFGFASGRPGTCES